MYILALDNSLSLCQAGLFKFSNDKGVVPLQKPEALPAGQDDTPTALDARDGRLMSEIERAIAAINGDLEKIDCIAVTIGPGSFTGIRIAISVARGLALVLGIPAIGVSTLEAISADHFSQRPASAPLCVAIDAGRNRAYAQNFDASGQSLTPAKLIALDSLMAVIPKQCYFAGNLAPILAEREKEPQRISPASLQIQLPIIAKIAQSASPDQSPPSPLYLRPADAMPKAAAPNMQYARPAANAKLSADMSLN